MSTEPQEYGSGLSALQNKYNQAPWAQKSVAVGSTASYYQDKDWKKVDFSDETYKDRYGIMRKASISDN